MAELPLDIRKKANVWVCDSEYSAHYAHFHLRKKNNRRLSDRQIMVPSVQSIPVVGIGDLKVAFMYLSGMRPFGVVQLTDVLRIPGVDNTVFLSSYGG